MQKWDHVVKKKLKSEGYNFNIKILIKKGYASKEE